jgi:hypothetical protein
MPGSAFEIGKDAIAPLAAQLTRLLAKEGFVIHDAPSSAADRTDQKTDDDLNAADMAAPVPAALTASQGIPFNDIVDGSSALV